MVTTPGFLRRSATHATFLTVGISQPLLQLYGDNNAVFTSARMSGGAVVRFALTVLLVPVAVVVALDVCAGFLPARARRPAREVVTALSAAPVGMLLLRSLPLPWAGTLALALVIAAVLAATVSRVGSVRSWVSWMSPLLPVVFVLFLVSAQSVVWEAKASVVSVNRNGTTTLPSGAADRASRTDPADVSVLWIQMDEAPLWPLLGSDGTVNAARFPGFAALAGNSTWYRNALGLSQTTVDAVPAMLTGKKPVTGKSPTFSNYRHNLFALAYGHRAMDVHEIATAVCPKEACATVSTSGSDAIAAGNAAVGVDATSTTTVTKVTEATVPTVSAAPPPDTAQFLHDALVVLGHKLLPEGLRDRLPRIDEGWGGFGATGPEDVTDPQDTVPGTSLPAGTSTSVPAATTTTPASGGGTSTTTTAATARSRSNTVRGWERDGAKSQVPVVQDMVERAARSDLATVHFAHVLLPHRPWQLTPDLRTTRFVSTDRRGPEVEDRVRDEYQAFLAQYAATDALILRMVNEMKRSANWDRTMIIVTADHGIAFEPGESKRKDINPDRVDTLEEIYRVPLFVKWPDQSSPEVSDCAVQGYDIMPSVVAATGLDAGWVFDGVDLRSTCPERSTRTVWWNGGKTTLSSGFRAARDSAARFDDWVDSDSGTDGIAMVSGTEDWFDVPVPADAARETAVRSWTLRDSPLFRDIRTEMFAKVPLQVDGNIRVSSPPGNGATGVIVMDGHVVAVVPEIAGMRAGTNPWRSVLLPSSLTAGGHSPVLYVARGTPSAPVLTLVGPPG